MDIKGGAINECNWVDVKTVNEIIDVVVARWCQGEEVMNTPIARTTERTGRPTLTKRLDEEVC